MREAVNRRRREPSYRPIVLIENATPRAGARGARRARLELPGVIYQQVPTRQYPTARWRAHLFGYVGEVTEAQLARPEYKGIEPGTMVGQAGRRAGLQQAADGRPTAPGT